ncbi:MAG: galactose mutarotase [Odoribacteraceae bacterium]|jgi:aldose 1-epimerase|nr:galactose mutarotase [Odoribacteraceae bacterium]
MFEHIKMKREDFRATVDGKETDLFFLRGESGDELAVTNFGARIVEWWTRDRNGLREDVVLGLDHVDKYVHYTGERFLGATVGRYGNRVAGGRFTLDGESYQLPVNNGPNSLHGGLKGFDLVAWDAVQEDERSVRFSLFSPDGDEGYPGNLRVEMTYTLAAGNALEIEWRAETDKPTIFNPTHHSYFNLHGEGKGTVLDHVLTIHADQFTPVDASLIPDGRLLPVGGTPFDFRVPTPVGARIAGEDEQLRYGKGYDHNWVLAPPREPLDLVPAASLYDPVSGRLLELATTTPGLQVYAGNWFDGLVKGKNGLPHGLNGGIALEPQHFPDSPNHPRFPSTVLRPGEIYRQKCVYRFSCR